VTLDQLARAALQHPDEASVGTLVHEAARLSVGSNGEGTGIRDALLALARSLDEGDAVTRSHSDRVGSLAARMAAELGMPEDEQRTVELAGRLHGLDGAGSAELASIRPMREAGELIRWFREHGNPAEGPLGAQIIAVANAYDELTAVPSGPKRGRGPALSEIRADRGKRFRAAAVEALGKVVGARPDRGQRRRREDAASSEKRSA
jgi:HD-GYP domain-containing protein (c-di-GMP phosphodiesterase class II)